MSVSDDGRTRPRLAYVYHPLSFEPFSIRDAAADVCEMVWVIDTEHAGATPMQRLLRKFGTVVDVAGLSVGEVAVRLRELGVDGVVSLHDADLVWTAHLAEALGCPFHSVDTARALTDKHAQRSALARAGLAVPRFEVIPADATEHEVAVIAAGFDYPAVVKPREGQSSRDTLPVDAPDELEATVARLREEHGGAGEEYILESFVPDPSTPLGGEGFAPFVSVESVVEGGRVAHAAISSRTPFRWPFRETGYCTPTVIESGLQRDILRVAGDAARALGVTIGCLHTEIKLTDDGPVVIEVNGRPGGGMSEMLERASGFSILRTALRLAVGDRVDLDGPVATDRIGYLLYVFPRTDLEWIDSVEGLPQLAEVDGVDEVILVRGPGQRIDWREGSEAHVFHLTGTVADFTELQTVIDLTTSLVHIGGRDGDQRLPSQISGGKSWT